MLSHEWHELAELSRRLDRLRGRYAAATREENSNIGAIESLRADLITTQRQHDQLLTHISKQLAASL